ncbi:MAG TPA: type II toxin-antitoxin system PemK/MazF family toxin [Tepidisphaeraceae bacterium]|nr:type II toxin-antitoxin system PemK/MazF family toxin [Tepidisphaeraceae bacterium]
MPLQRPELRRGRIIWATLRDHNGIEKHRPAVVLTPTDDICEDEPIVVVAVTTTFADPPPADHVLLPWDPQGRTLTKLRKRSAAVLSWIVEVLPNDIVECQGDLPAPLVTRILKSLDQQRP